MPPAPGGALLVHPTASVLQRSFAEVTVVVLYQQPPPPTFADLCHDADEKMFAAITSDRNHVVRHLLPPQSTGSQNYNLRQRTHNLALPSRTGHLTDNNFIQRMLYFDVY